MSTTDHRNAPEDNTVLSLAERQRRARARLEALLDVRARLAAVAAEQRSHDLPEKWESTRLLYAVEELIHDECPELYDRRLPAWAEADDALMHHPPVLLPECSICRAIAAHRGVNLHRPPEAA